MQDDALTGSMARGLGAARWRGQLGAARMLGWAAVWAGAIGTSALIKVPLPGTPVPMTLQTLPVLLAGILLGPGWGVVSVVMYIAAGVAGVPWFAGTQGWAALVGPTGGYLIGFVVATILLGCVYERYGRAWGWVALLAMMTGGAAIIYVLGVAQLGLWLTLVQGKAVSLGGLLSVGMMPFVVGDAVKVIAATAVVRAIQRS